MRRSASVRTSRSKDREREIKTSVKVICKGEAKDWIPPVPADAPSKALKRWRPGNEPPLEEINKQLDYFDKMLNEHDFLIFVTFRGTWCPYARPHLSTFNHIAKSLNMRGGALIALVTEDLDDSVQAAADWELAPEYELHLDPYCVLAFRLGIYVLPHRSHPRKMLTQPSITVLRKKQYAKPQVQEELAKGEREAARLRPEADIILPFVGRSKRKKGAKTAMKKAKEAAKKAEELARKEEEEEKKRLEAGETETPSSTTTSTPAAAAAAPGKAGKGKRGGRGKGGKGGGGGGGGGGGDGGGGHKDAMPNLPIPDMRKIMRRGAPAGVPFAEPEVFVDLVTSQRLGLLDEHVEVVFQWMKDGLTQRPDGEVLYQKIILPRLEGRHDEIKIEDVPKSGMLDISVKSLKTALTPRKKNRNSAVLDAEGRVSRTSERDLESVVANADEEKSATLEGLLSPRVT